MKILRLCMSVILFICLVVSTIGSDLFGASMMFVKATGAELALGLDVMYEICEYFGSTFMTYSCGRSLPEISDDDLARLGHDFLRAYSETMYEFGLGPNPASFDGSFAMVDYNGQSYVFGTEALKETAETEFTVIQGGKNNGDDNDDDNDNDDENEDNIIHFPQKVAGAGKLAVAMTTSLASLAFSCCADAYHKWVDGDEDNLLDPFFEQYPDITASDIANQYNGHGFKFNMKAVTKDSYNCSYCGKTFYGVYSVSDLDCFTPTAVYVSGGGSYGFKYINNKGIPDSMFPRITYTYTCCGRYSVSSSYAINEDIISSFTANVPIFTNFESCNNYLKTGTGYEDATNFAKEYRNADWMQDDWAGKLLDPLTGLNALSNWYNIARHQGLNALGDDPSADDMSDYLRDYFAQLGMDVLPEVDPSLAPIKYPATLPDVVIDPAANPAVTPATTPGVNPDPGTNPNPGIDPDPGINPNPNPGTVVDIPIEDIVPTVNDSFSDIAVSLKYKFPFSIPWDIHHIFSVLADTPKAPYFELPLVIERYGINEKIVIDMSRFQVLSNLSRSMFSMLFAIFLINLTFRVVAMRKEE